MTLDQILATPRRIKFVNNTGHNLDMFSKEIDAAIFADSTELPEEIADLIRIEYVQLGDERRAIIWPV